MKKRTFTLDDDDIKLLKEISKNEGISQSEVVRKGIAKLRNGISDDEPTKEVVKLLKERLALADSQNTELMRIVETQSQERLLETGAKKHRFSNLFRRDKS